jgi:hypothetical protein
MRLILYVIFCCSNCIVAKAGERKNNINNDKNKKE